MAGVPNFHFIKTQRDGDALVVDEYVFRVRKRVGTKKYWRCHTDQCGVTVVTDGANFLKIKDTAAHNHVSEEHHVKRRDFVQNVCQVVQLFSRT